MATTLLVALVLVALELPQCSGFRFALPRNPVGLVRRGRALQAAPDAGGPPPRVFSWPWPSPALNNELAGDAGFDPCGFVKTREDLFLYREAEIKHSRIAMLGSLGFPISELYHAVLSKNLGLPNLLQDGKVPSILNGGIENEYFLASLGGFFAVGATLELELARRKRDTPESLRNFLDLWREDDWETPGNYQFDPLRLGKTLCGDDPNKKKLLQTIELFNGRMSMLAVTGYTAQEYFTGKPLIEETPQFFYFPQAQAAVDAVLSA